MGVDDPGVDIGDSHQGIASTAAPKISPAATSVTGFVGSFATGPVGVPTPVSSLGQFTQLFGTAEIATEASVAVVDFFANGGSNAFIVRALSRSRPPTGTQLVDAMQVLAAEPGKNAPIQLLCMPDMARRRDRLTPAAADALMRAAVAFCTDNRIFLLVDPNLLNDDSAEIGRWIQQSSVWRSPNTAAYVPRLMTEASELLPGGATAASGAVAGVMARIDATRGVWKAPAGIEAAVDGKPVAEISDREQSPLNRQGVNAIRSVDGAGLVVWGSRTGVGAIGEIYRYVHVRRTALFLENSLRAGLRWVPEEENDARLWARVVASVSDFLSRLWRQGAFGAATADQAFFVRCDPTTMSRVDLRRGRTVLNVGAALLRPGEFVVFSITFPRR